MTKLDDDLNEATSGFTIRTTTDIVLLPHVDPLVGRQACHHLTEALRTVGPSQVLMALGQMLSDPVVNGPKDDVGELQLKAAVAGAALMTIAIELDGIEVTVTNAPD